MSFKKITIYILTIIVFLLNLYNIFKFKIFNYRNINYLLFFMNILFLFFILILFKNLKKISLFILYIYIAVSGILCFNIYKVDKFLNKLNKNVMTNEYTISIVTRKGSRINNLNQIGDEEVLAVFNSDDNNIQELIKDIKNNAGIDINVKKTDSYSENYQKLMNKEIELMILNSSYENILELYDDNFQENIKKIYELKIIKENNTQISNVFKKSFNVYISGIDTFGSIGTVSRSDVNILMSVNLETNEILIVSFPRDSYVKIPNGGKDQFDKLTHSGIYGIETSVKTLENLLDIEIDYYIRVNFTSFLRLIDIIGGIKIQNDQEFKSLHGDFFYPIGMIDLNSEKALSFVRERYSLKNGDIDRIKNQQKVIIEIIKRVIKTRELKQIKEIMNEIQDSVQTNISKDNILQIFSKILLWDEYNIQTTILKGKGSMTLKSFAMPNNKLYMYHLDGNHINETKIKINELLKGNK